MKPWTILILATTTILLQVWGSHPVLAQSHTAATDAGAEVDGTVLQRTRTFPQSPPPTLRGVPDPDLEPGFPVQAPHGGGTYHGGPAIHTTVADLTGNGRLEIVVTALATGPLWAWNSDGGVAFGWPSSGTSGAAYAAAGNLGGASNAFELFAGFWGGDLTVLRKDATTLPGWPQSSANYVTTPPALADVDGDGFDEMFIGEEDWRVHGYAADGSVLPGWPIFVALGGQERHTPAIGDLDGDGDLEVVCASGSSTPGVYLFAWHHDGTPVAGYPVLFPSGYVDTFPAIGDVDGDFVPEIVLVLRQTSFPWHAVVTLIAADGTIERQWTAGSTASYGTAPALADLDGDTVPDIVVQTQDFLEVWNGLGTPLPGWPATWSGRWLGNSAPVVGDVTGDGLPDVVVTTQEAGSSELGEVRAFTRTGTPLPGFPKSLPLGAGAVPALADLDADGRNEIVVTGSFWNLFPGMYDKVWVYDLGGSSHGVVQWGQFGGGPGHSGAFATRVELKADALTLHWTPNDAADRYDVVAGDLGSLQSNGGDFSLATSTCVGEDVPGTSLTVFDDPDPGEGTWYLVRPATTVGSGSYDSGGVGQAAPRDAGVAGSVDPCLS